MMPTQAMMRQSALHPDPAWRSRMVSILMLAIVLWPLLAWSEFKPWILLDQRSMMAAGRFLAGFFPPEHSSEFLWLVAEAAWQTVAIATTGMTLAMASALPLTLIATERISVSRLADNRMRPAGRIVRQAVRWLLVVLRSVPELVWALLLVRIVGLGPTAGVLAIALTYCGMLGKVYSEILESGDPHVTDTLLRNGAGRMGALLYGSLPESASELVSYTIYRWECAIRGSVVMGFVGAGGLGQRMEESMKMLAGGEVSTMLLIFVGLVMCADGVSKMLRGKLA
jgi:phosphonate transport system permease protein